MLRDWLSGIERVEEGIRWGDKEDKDSNADNEKGNKPMIYPYPCHLLLDIVWHYIHQSSSKIEESNGFQEEDYRQEDGPHVQQIDIVGVIDSGHDKRNNRESIGNHVDRYEGRLHSVYKLDLGEDIFEG